MRFTYYSILLWIYYISSCLCLQANKQYYESVNWETIEAVHTTGFLVNIKIIIILI